jgi:hypothetical protein
MIMSSIAFFAHKMQSLKFGADMTTNEIRSKSPEIGREAKLEEVDDRELNLSRQRVEDAGAKQRTEETWDGILEAALIIRIPAKINPPKQMTAPA